ncbi:MAG: aspartate-semialdehyde dehydrogenase [Candidatus Omnitrophica bacterium]|nr:aspartate-semialdehyde dehydrogenase [Candidatus Omnitrophota bacterium]MCM8789241.1 aspartate-semialdehyde dehydrogenase [Candidatus Omnitrophota bacterium]
MRKYNVAVVGAGLVGKKMVEVLLERNFPLANIRIMATRERKEIIAGRSFAVEKISEESFNGVDFAFFAGTEGEKGASMEFGWKAVEKGAIVIDNGGDFRMHPDVPLVIPEVNPEHLNRHKGLIANPNCSTIIMLMAVAPLDREYHVKRIIVSTYQAVSGTGSKAVEELKTQLGQYLSGQKITKDVYPYRILFNVIPHIGSLSDQFSGYYTEEVKMIQETRKILDRRDILISATCVRVPVFNGHSEAITVQFELTPDSQRCREILSSTKGVNLLDEPEKAIYPVPIDVSGRDDVFVGRIRTSTALENAIDMWVVGDNIKKGAAQNAVQIAEKMIEMRLF